MESVKQKCKEVLGRCRRRCHVSSRYNMLSSKKKARGDQVAPHGFIWVRVGEHRTRFMMRIELLNHPIIQKLLEDAEREYGFNNDGPIWLPCHVDLFSHALAQMEDHEEEEEDDSMNSSNYSSNKSYPNSVMHSPLSYLSTHHYYQILSPSIYVSA